LAPGSFSAWRILFRFPFFSFWFSVSVYSFAEIGKSEERKNGKNRKLKMKMKNGPYKTLAI
jgi:hypothetical protein